MTTDADAATRQRPSHRRSKAQVERDRLAVLKKREDHLWKRIGEADAAGRDLCFDKAEASALHWILAEYQRMKEAESE